MSRPTYQQLEALADFLTQNPGIAKGFLRTAHGKFETKRKWDEITITINALGGAQKDGKGWAKYWADKKCALKKTCAQLAQSIRRTGGGAADEMPSLTPIDQRLIAVMGGPQFAAGDSHVSINPFPSTSQTQNSVVLEVTQDIVPESPPIQIAETNRVPTPSPSPPRSPLRRRSPRRNQRQHPRAGRTLLDVERERFTAIEAQRVEAEAVTARALSHAVEHISNLATAIDGLSTAMRDGAQAIADALIRIAERPN